MAGVDLSPWQPSPSPPAYKREPSASSSIPTHRPNSSPFLRTPRCSLLALPPSRSSARPSQAIGTSSDPGDTTVNFTSSSSLPSTPPSSTRTTGVMTTPMTRSSSPLLPHYRPTPSTSRRRDRSVRIVTSSSFRFPLCTLRCTSAMPSAIGLGCRPTVPVRWCTMSRLRALGSRWTVRLADPAVPEDQLFIAVDAEDFVSDQEDGPNEDEGLNF